MSSVREHRGWSYCVNHTIVSRALAAAMVLLATRAASQEAAPTYTVLYSFTGGANGGGPEAGLIADAAGDDVQRRHHQRL